MPHVTPISSENIRFRVSAATGRNPLYALVLLPCKHKCFQQTTVVDARVDNVVESSLEGRAGEQETVDRDTSYLWFSSEA